MDDSHDHVRVAPASPGDAGDWTGSRQPRGAGVPGAARVEQQHSLPQGKGGGPAGEAGAVPEKAGESPASNPAAQSSSTSGESTSSGDSAGPGANADANAGGDGTQPVRRKRGRRGGNRHMPHGSKQGPNGQKNPSRPPSTSQTQSGRHSAAKAGSGPRADNRNYAAVDLGTNNCRLLIARPSGVGFEVVDAFSRIVRLGEGLGTSQHLAEEAMDRAVAALRICASKMRRRNVARARVVTTQACRHADNSDIFMRRVARETGLDMEVLSPEEEARLAVIGCAPLLDRSASKALVFDIGGGSTELVWLDMTANGPRGEPEPLAWASLPVGVVTLADRYDGRTVNRAGYESMVAEVKALLADRPWAEELDAELAAATESGDIHLLGTSGTVTTIAGIHLGLRRYDRSKVDGIWVDFADVAAVTDGLSLMSFDERARVPCIGKDRADLVLAGCAILEAIRTTWPCRRLRVADRGLREGILMTLMREDRGKNKRKRRRRGGRNRNRRGARPADSPAGA